MDVQRGPSPRFRAWCFTLNNPKDTDAARLAALVDPVDSRFRYIAWGEEVGESGTPHLQGFLYMKNPVSLIRLRMYMPEGIRPHFEAMRGTFKQAIAYCKKDGEFHEFGKAPAQGERSDLRLALAAARGGLSIREALESGLVVSIAAFRVFPSLVSVLRPVPPDIRPMRVCWIHGATGLGKSTGARAIVAGPHPLSSVYVRSDHSDDWWRGYTGQTGCVLDDIAEVNNRVLQVLYNVLSGLTCSVRTIGGSEPCRITHCVITSSRHPLELFASADLAGRYAEMCRRLEPFCVRHISSQLCTVEPGSPPALRLSEWGERLQNLFHAPEVPTPADVAAALDA